MILRSLIQSLRIAGSNALSDGGPIEYTLYPAYAVMGQRLPARVESPGLVIPLYYKDDRGQLLCADCAQSVANGPQSAGRFLVEAKRNTYRPIDCYGCTATIDACPEADYSRGPGNCPDCA